MLKIQRASAGSGKTFALAKTYIELFLTIADRPEGKRRLRTPHEIADSMQHILAVTFTNKATAEMKERIVSKLAALAAAGAAPSDAPEPDYLSDLQELTSASRQEVTEAAKHALKALLLEYSDFNISTIDSFFQSILRTFAYETDMSDSYQLELDGDYTALVGVDTTLDQLISPQADPDILRWLRMIMHKSLDKGYGWNPFQRKASSRSVYKDLISNVKAMESEEFKIIREALHNYFESGAGLFEAMTEIDSRILSQISELERQLANDAKALKDEYALHGIDFKTESYANLPSRVEKCITGNYKDIKFSRTTNMFRSKSPHNKAPYAERFVELHDKMGDSLEAALAIKSSIEVRLWQKYKELLPFLPLMHDAAKNIHRYLEQTNTMQISDTNTLLRRIIGDDDTPFIYERLGTHINHFLIDEFQDTSRLQWENFRPLLEESEGRGNRNLIIGDAKQSIYRFRNADPSLISEVVPANFPGHLAAGYSIAENTNWRSMRNVVEFNNLFFHALSNSLNDKLAELYSNVVQHPRHSTQEGYVEYNIFSSSQNDDDDSDNSAPLHIRKAGEIVKRLLDRGYRQKEIAFLTSKNQQNDQIIDALMQYNHSLGEGEQRIEFISDQSLLLTKSRSVQVIVAALRTISKGLNPCIRKGAEAVRKGTADWWSISSRFDFLQARYPELSADKIVVKILEDDEQDTHLSDLLSEMQSVALPSLTEAIAERFVPRELRKTEAAFLAAFQDTVLSYCENNISDIASFLEWWDRKSATLSITSPEDIDAVRIMTIHKSKGLEFDCVILPYANMKFTPSIRKKEWRWVKPDPSLPGAEKLPPYLPVTVDKELEDTPHAHLWDEINHLVAMDSINMAYVGFTRAVKELYIWSPVSNKEIKKLEDGSDDGLTIASQAEHIFNDWDSEKNVAALDHPDQFEDLPHLTPEITESQMPHVWRRYTYGAPLSQDRIAELHDKESREGTKKMVARIEEYGINSSRGILKYRDADFPEPDLTDDPDADNPRSEGTIMHKIMEGIEIEEDLYRSIRKLRIHGALTEDDAVRFGDILRNALAGIRHTEWFAGKYRVITERSLLKAHSKTLRPDRIMISPAGEAIVVDYKFGHQRHSQYHRQISEYTEALMQTGKFKSAKGYIWYVTLGKVEEVC